MIKDELMEESSINFIEIYQRNNIIKIQRFFR